MEEIKPNYTRVTEPLGVFHDFSMIPPSVLEAACIRGTAAHESIENCLKYYFNDGNPYLESFLKWYEVVKPTHCETEQRFYDNDYKLTGCVDLIFKMSGDGKNEVNIMDFKTPIAKSKTWACQLSAYKMLVERTTGKVVKRLFALRVKKDGSKPTITEYTENYEEALDIYLCALKAYRYLK